MAVRSRPVWMGAAVWYHIELAGYFYQPMKPQSAGQTVFIPQGGDFGFLHYGGITAFGRIFDAFTDPMIASWSDRCTSKKDGGSRF